MVISFIIWYMMFAPTSNIVMNARRSSIVLPLLSSSTTAATKLATCVVNIITDYLPSFNEWLKPYIGQLNIPYHDTTHVQPVISALCVLYQHCEQTYDFIATIGNVIILLCIIIIIIACEHQQRPRASYGQLVDWLQ